MKARRGLKLGFPVSNQEMVAQILFYKEERRFNFGKTLVEREN